MIKPAKCYLGEVLDRFFPKPDSRQGFRPRWDKCKHIYFGRGQLSVWTGFNGHGKSLFLNQMMLEAIDQGERVCIASYEMTPGRTLHRLVKQATGEITPEELEITNCLEWYGDSLLVHGHMGQINAERVIKLFTEQAAKGVTQFVVDSLMKCGLDEDDYNGQKRVADWLQGFAQKHNVHIHLVAHPRKGMDEYQVPGKMDVRGTGSITDMADNVFTVWRNKQKADLIEKFEAGETTKQSIHEIKAMYDAVLCCSKSRDEPEAEGKYGLYYQWGTFQYHDQQNEQPYRYYSEKVW
jgi:twinkle protein